MNLSDEQQEVIDAVLSFKYPVILVRGQAGVGKSVVIREIQNRVQNTLTVTSKGLAAQNINGGTIHKTFGYPTGKTYDPSLTKLWTFREQSSAPNLRFFKTDHLRACQLLIIDECFDVRCDLFDFIDRCLREARREPRVVFGGLHVVLVGDEGQSQPIVGDDLKSLKKYGYRNPYGIHESRTWHDSEIDRITKSFTLTKIFRQQNATDGLILARIRTGTQTDLDLEHLNRNVTYYPPAGCTVLTPYIHRMNTKNECLLELNRNPLMVFEAEARGTYKQKKDKHLPYPKVLHLKIGCRVIIRKNQSKKVGGYLQQTFNGDQGELLSIDKHERLVILLDRGEEVRISKVTETSGMKVRKKKNDDGEETEELIPNKANSYKQYPIRLGYAITISASQGMTMDKVFLDLGSGLWDDAYGLLYVALSRVKSLKHLYLSRKLRHEDNKVSPLLEGVKPEQYSMHQVLS